MPVRDNPATWYVAYASFPSGCTAADQTTCGSQPPRRSSTALYQPGRTQTNEAILSCLPPNSRPTGPDEALVPPDPKASARRRSRPGYPRPRPAALWEAKASGDALRGQIARGSAAEEVSDQSSSQRRSAHRRGGRIPATPVAGICPRPALRGYPGDHADVWQMETTRSLTSAIAQGPNSPLIRHDHSSAAQWRLGSPTAS